MSVTTTLELEDETLSALQDLAEINRDSVAGFNEAAETIESVKLAALFREIAVRRQGNAAALGRLLTLNDEESDDGTSFASKLHRGWIDVKGAIVGKDQHSILAECERGENVIKKKYESLLPKVAGSPVTSLLNDQYAQVKMSHDRIRDLREAWAKN